MRHASRWQREAQGRLSSVGCQLRRRQVYTATAWPVLLLLCNACGAHAVLPQQRRHARPPRCRGPGADPGRWARTRWDAERPGRGMYPYYNRLDDSPDSVWLGAAIEPPDTPFGSAWRTVDPACQPENLLQQFLGQRFVRNVTIVLLGDSVDAQLLDFACGEAAARNVTGWAAFLHSHGAVNYCSLPSGLHLVQMYVQRYGREADLARINATRAFVLHGDDEAAHGAAHDARVGRHVLLGRQREARAIADAAASAGGRPSLVVFSAAHYWMLLRFAGDHRRAATAAAGGDDAAGEATPPPDVLSDEEVAHYMSTTSELLSAARAAFPGAPLVAHTSPEVRTGCDDGVQPIASEKPWARRPYVTALNAALRALAARARTPLVDLELMGAAFTPAQLLKEGDQLHPRSWFQLEVLNLYLNLAAQHGTAGGGRTARHTAPPRQE